MDFNAQLAKGSTSEFPPNRNVCSNEHSELEFFVPESHQDSSDDNDCQGTFDSLLNSNSESCGNSGQSSSSQCPFTYWLDGWKEDGLFHVEYSITIETCPSFNISRVKTSICRQDEADECYESLKTKFVFFEKIFKKEPAFIRSGSDTYHVYFAKERAWRELNICVTMTHDEGPHIIEWFASPETVFGYIAPRLNCKVEEVLDYSVLNDADEEIVSSEPDRRPVNETGAIGEPYQFSLLFRFFMVLRRIQYFYEKLWWFAVKIGWLMLFVGFLPFRAAQIATTWYRRFVWNHTVWSIVAFVLSMREGMLLVSRDPERAERLGIYGTLSDEDLLFLGLPEDVLNSNKQAVAEYIAQQGHYLLKGFYPTPVKILEIETFVAEQRAFQNHFTNIAEDHPIFVAESKAASLEGGRCTRKSKHTVNTDDHTPVPTGLVFSGDPFYGDVLLGETLSTLTWDNVPSILTNLKKSIPHNSDRETYRGFSTLCRDWRKGSRGREALKVFLSSLEYESTLSEKTKFLRPDCFVPLQEHRDINFPMPKHKFFQENGGSCFTFADKVQFEPVSHNKSLTLQKIRCMIKSMLETHTSRQIVQRLKDQMIVKKVLPDWAQCWVPTEVLYLAQCDSQVEQLNAYLVNSANILRKGIIDFAYEYIRVSALPLHEKREYFVEKCGGFIKVMQSPQVQSLFMQGKTREEIIDHVYKNCSREVELFSTNKRAERAKYNAKLGLKRSRGLQRDKKIFFQGQSVGAVSFFAAIVFLASAFYYFRRSEVDELFRRGRRLTVYCAQTLDAMNRVVTRADNTVGAVETALDRVINVWEHVDDLDKVGGVLADFKSVIQIFYCWHIGEYKMLMLTAGDLILRHPSKLKNLTQDMFDFVGKMRGKPTQETTFEAQSSGGLDMVSPLLNLLYSFGGISMSPVEMRDANTRFQLMSNVARSLNDTSEILKAIISYVGLELYAYDPFDSVMRQYVSEVRDFIDKVDQLIMKELDIPLNMKLCRSILDARDRGISLRSAYKKDNVLFRNDEKFSKLNAAMRQLYSDRFKIIERLALKAQPAYDHSGLRPEPVGILFTGAPNTAKSQSFRFLCRLLHALEQRDRPADQEKEPFHEQLIFYAEGGQKYYDTYARQPFVSMDDTFASVSEVDTTLEAMFILKAVNSVPMQMNMAECDLKGRVFFGSEYLFLTSNIANDGYNTCNFKVGLRDPSAIQRRVHFAIHADTQFAPGLRLEDLTFRLDKCLSDRTLESRRFNLVDLAKLIYEKRNTHRRWFKENDKPDEYFDNLIAESLFTEIRDHMKFYTDKVVKTNEETFDYCFKGFLAICALTAFGAASYKLYSVFQTQEITLESDERFRTRFAKHVKRNKQNSRPTPHKFEPQSKTNYEACLHSTLSRSVVAISIWDGTAAPQDTCSGLHIKDGYILTVAHGLMASLQRGFSNIKVKWSTGVQVVSKEELNLVYFDDKDYIAFRLKDLSNLPASSYKFIPEPSCDFEIPFGTPVTLCLIDSEGAPSFRTMTKRTEDNKDIKYEHNDTVYVVEAPISYFGETRGGDSGSPITVMGPEGKVVLLGMHLCSSTNASRKYGVSLRYNRSDIDYILSCFETQFVAESSASKFPLEVLRKATPRTYPPQKHSIVPSPMYGCFGPAEKRPASLSENAYYRAVKKMRQDPQRGKWLLSDESSSYMLNLYPPQPSKVRTIEEALNGYIDELGNKMPSLRHDTNGGYGFSDKSKFVTKVDCVSLPTDAFRAHIEKCISRMEEGDDTLEFPMYDCLKVELRPNAKVDSEDSRLFSCAPYDHTILMKMYFGDFVSYIESLCNTHPICVGLNVHGVAWRDLHDQVLSVGGGIVSGDASKFDANVKYETIMQVACDANKWYNDSEANQAVRIFLMRKIAESIHVFKDVVYKTTGGVASGVFGTSIIDSWALCRMLYDIFSFVFHLREDQFRLKTFGDDNLNGVPLGAVNFKQLSEAFKERFDIVYTHWSKQEIERDDSIYECRFLGRAFEEHNNQMMAPLDRKIVEQMCYYYENKDLEMVHLSTSASFFLEASHFGEKVFREMRLAYLEAVRTRMPQLYTATQRIAYDYWYFFNGRYSDKRRVNFCVIPEESGWIKVPDHKNRALGVDSPSEVLEPVGNFEEEKEIKFSAQSSSGQPVKVADPDRILTDVDIQQDSVLGAEQSQGVIVDAHPERRFPLNFTKYELKAFMEREYTVGSFSISTTDASNTKKLALSFPGDLMNVGSLQAVAQLYRSFRAGVKVKIVGSVAKTLYGQFMADWFPYHCNMTSNSSSVTLRSGREHVVIRHELDNVVEMEFPFVSPYRYLDPWDYFSDEIGLLTFSTVSTLYNANGTAATANYTVTAAFTDVELSLPVPPSGLTSSDHEVEPLEKPKFHANSTSAAKKEAQRKAEDGSFSSLISTASEMISKVTIGEAATAVAATLLDKPPNVSLQGNPQPKFWTHDFHGKGVSNANTAAVSQDAVCATDQIFGQEDRTLLRDIACTPMHIYTITVSSTSSPVPLIVLDSVTNANFDKALSSMFTYRTGGYKVKIYVSCTTLHSARMAFYLGRTTGMTTTGKEYNYCESRVVDINGPMDIEFFLPDVSQFYAKPTDDSSWSLWFNTLSYSAPLAAATPIILNVYSSAAEDVAYYLPKEAAVTFTPNSNPRKDFKKHFEPLHEGATFYKPEGVFADTYTSIYELMKTRTCYGSKSNNSAWSTPMPLKPVYGSSNTFFGLDMYLLFYNFWRGSIEFKFAAYDTNTNAMYLCNKSDLNTPYCDMSSAAEPVNEMRKAYYHSVCAVPTRYNGVYPDNDISYFKLAPKGNGTMWFSAGDDFRVSHLMYPPWDLTWGNLGTYGIPAVISKYTGG